VRERDESARLGTVRSSIQRAEKLDPSSLPSVCQCRDRLHVASKVSDQKLKRLTS